MTHPSEAELRRFLDGRSSPELSETIADHLDACESCHRAAERLTDVPLDFWAMLVAAGGRAASPPSFEGPTITGYEDFRLLRRGGCGVVYLATESASGRQVAVKLLRDWATASPLERASFIDEARAASHLRHPNIVTVLAVGVERGQPFYAMEYIPAGSLADRLDGKPLAPSVAAGVLAEIARAVHHAHDAGVIHRDLKPGNILLDAPTRPGPPWTPKVADFGMAKLREAAVRSATPTQAVLGTPSYMSPEQAFGRSRHVGPAADVHALGAVLYELLTGRPPFRGASPFETLVKVRDEAPVPPGRLRPGLPRDLETVCLKCLEKDPTRRYVSASALAEDLEAFLAGRPVAARPVGPLGRLERWARREPVVAGLIGAAVLLVAMLLVVVTIAWQRARDQNAKLLESLVYSAEASSKLFSIPILAPMVNRAGLARQLEVFERLPDLSSSPEQEHRLAYATLQMANGLQAMGETYHSGRAVRRARATFTRLMRSYPDRSLFAFRYAQACMQLAGLERTAGRKDEEGRLHLEAFRVLEGLVQRYPEDDVFASDLEVFRSRVARDLIEVGRRDEAEPLLVKSMDGLRKLIARYPQDPVRYGYFRDASHALGVLRLRRDDVDGFEALIRERLEMCDRARSREGWPVLFLSLLQDHDYVVTRRAGRERTAEQVVAHALTAWRETVARDPTSSSYRVSLAIWVAADGDRKRSSDPSAARDDFRRAIAILEPLLEGPGRSEALDVLAWLRGLCPDPSIRDPEKAVAHARAFKSEFNPKTFLLGLCLCESGAYEAARAELEGFLAEDLRKWDGWQVQLVRLYLALAYQKLGEPDRAADEVRAARAHPTPMGEVVPFSYHDAALRRVEALLAE